tara:strand:+ start:841 stop:2103 length:1263 start_codon:yes stop_codon:yes gene_type:complete
MKKYNVLIFPAYTEIATEILDSLSDSKAFNTICFTSKDPLPSYHYLPLVDSPDFKAALLKAITSHSIDYIFPAHDLFIDFLAINYAEFSQLASLVINKPEIIELTRSKRATYKALKDYVIVPDVYDSLDDAKFPLFVKPDRGFGSNESYIVFSPNELSVNIFSKKNIISEYLPGTEFTIDCITNANGELLVFLIRKRDIISSGISKLTSIVIEDKNISKMANIINSRISLRGAWFFQVKLNSDGIPTLLEIGPRISGNMGLIRANGINAVLSSLYIIGQKKQITSTYFPYFKKVFRRLEYIYEQPDLPEHVYIDLDDTILIEYKVNPYAVAFLLRCNYLSIPVTLITRHKGNLEKHLKELYLSHYFKRTIQIKDPNINKSSFINIKNSIFIDDSHTERYEVHSKISIPVFDASILKYLLV